MLAETPPATVVMIKMVSRREDVSMLFVSRLFCSLLRKGNRMIRATLSNGRTTVTTTTLRTIRNNTPTSRVFWRRIQLSSRRFVSCCVLLRRGVLFLGSYRWRTQKRSGPEYQFLQCRRRRWSSYQHTRKSRHAMYNPY
jgi:hypothetical protein